MRPSQMGQGASPEKSEKKPDQKTEHLPPHCHGFFWNVPPHKKGPKKAFTHKKGPKKAFDTGGPWGQVKREPIRLTRHYSRKVWKKTWPENGTPAPTLPRFFLEHPTTQKGSKKSLRTQKGSKKSLRHWRPMRPSEMGTYTSDTCPHTAHTKRVQKKPSHTKRVQKKPSTLEAHEAKSNGNPYVWQGTIPERSEKKPDQKTEHLPPHCQGFFWNVPPHKNGPKKAFTYRKGPKKTFDTGGPWGQMGTHTSDKALFQKGLKKNLTRKRNTCPHTAKVFFGTSHHTKRVQKKPSHTKRVQKKPSTLEAHEAKSNGNPYVWHLPPHCQAFFGTSHHTKRVQKKPSHTKGPKKTSSGNPYVWQGTIPESSEKSLTRTCHTKRVKKKPSEASRKKGPDQQNERLLPHWRHTGLSYGQPSKKVKKKPRRYRKKPSPYIMTYIYAQNYPHVDKYLPRFGWFFLWFLCR